jgi:hypothetical protein
MAGTSPAMTMLTNCGYDVRDNLRCGRSVSPKAVAGEPGSFHQSPKFGPGYFRIDLISGTRCAEATIRTGNDAFTAD